MNKTMNNDVYQKIYEILNAVLPNRWENIIFTAEYGEESYEMKYYADTGDGKMKDCFELAVVTRTQLAKAFIAINNFIAPERNSLEPKHKWKTMIFNFSQDGKFNVDFKY